MLLQNHQTDCRPPDQRFTHWVSEISQFFGNIEFDSPQRHNFRQQVIRAEIDGVRFCRSRGSATSARRRNIPREIAPLPFGQQSMPVTQLQTTNSYCLLLKLGASQCVVGPRADIVLRPGDMVLMKLGEPFTIAHGEDSDSMMLAIPDSLFAFCWPRVCGRRAACFSPSEPAITCCRIAQAAQVSLRR